MDGGLRRVDKLEKDPRIPEKLDVV